MIGKLRKKIMKPNVPKGKKSTDQRGMRIVTGIIYILVISIIFVLLIGGIGYSSMGRIASNADNIYNNRLLPIVTIGEMQDQYYIVKYNLNMGTGTSFYHEYDKNIKSSNTAITKLIEEYEGMGVDEKEAPYLESFKSSYEDYITTWEEIKKDLSSGKDTSSLQKNKLKTIETNLDNSLHGLVRYNKSLAEKLKEENESIYDDNLKIYIAIVTISLVLIAGFTLLIICIIRRSMKSMIGNLDKLAEGDFTEEITGLGKTEFGVMKTALVKVVQEISTTFHLVKRSSGEIEHYSHNLSTVAEEMSASSQGMSVAIQEVSQGASYQSDELGYISTSIIEFGEELDSVVASIEEVRGDTVKTNTMARGGNEKLGSLMESIQSIESLFNMVGEKVETLGVNIGGVTKVTDIINTISDQTDLLALNAAIEAARAGAAGQGFGVVADEVRKLAEQSKTASQNINDMIKMIREESEMVVQTVEDVKGHLVVQTEEVNDTIKLFQDIIQSIENILPQINTVTRSIVTINNSKDDIIGKVKTVSTYAEGTCDTSRHIAASSQEVNSASEELAATSHELNEMTKRLNDTISRFKLRQ